MNWFNEMNNKMNNTGEIISDRIAQQCNKCPNESVSTRGQAHPKYYGLVQYHANEYVSIL